ncbi:hypothetical protein LDENG_00237650 [Lucifuga dentata]|nr:hypothetical protein LDENG_00237650 [Lucifuga dentata]
MSLLYLYSATIRRDIRRCPRYIHRGSCRNFIYRNNSINSTCSFWSTDRRKPTNSGRSADHSVLASVPKAVPVTEPSTCEILAVQLNGSTPTIVAVIYRPPKPSTAFLPELTSILTNLYALSPNVILMGDFNIHLDNPTNALTMDFNSVLDSFDLTQFVSFPTHSKGHILDLVCCSGISPCNFNSLELPISDHKIILFDITVPVSKSAVERSITFQNIKNLNISELNSLVTSSDFLSCPSSSTADLVNHYNDCLSHALDILASQKTCTVSFVHSAQWYTSELHQLKTQGRRLE